MAHDVCILFAYHKNDEVTLRHFELVQKHNPGVPIVPITHAHNGTIPQTVDLAHSPGRWEIGDGAKDKWRNLDAWIYNWFEQVPRVVTARRYILLEWDCYCNCSVRKFYKKVWHANLACAQIKTAKDDWYWWTESDRLGIFQEKARGVVPLAGVMISEWLLEQIKILAIEQPGMSFQNVFCELRLGTLASLVTENIKEIPGAKDKFLTAHELLDGPCNGPGIYHSIKH